MATTCECAEFGVEVWLQNFGCQENCASRRLLGVIDLQVQRSIDTHVESAVRARDAQGRFVSESAAGGGRGTMSFPLSDLGNLYEVWPNQTAVIVKACGKVVFAGVVKELSLQNGIVGLGMETWDEWLGTQYLHENFVVGNPPTYVYKGDDGTIYKDANGNDAQCTLHGLQITAAQAIARLVEYAGDPNRATPLNETADLGAEWGNYGDNSSIYGEYQQPFCVPCVESRVVAPDTKPLDYTAQWCEPKSIQSIIHEISELTGVEWVTDAVQDPETDCWCFRMVVSDHLGSEVPVPVFAPGSSVAIVPAKYDASWGIAGQTCYPPQCTGTETPISGEKVWGGCDPHPFISRATREEVFDHGETFLQGNVIRDIECARLRDNPVRDRVQVRLNLGADQACVPDLEIGGRVQVDLGPGAGCFLGLMRVSADTFTLNADQGLVRELTLDPIDVDQTLFSSDCEDCSDC